MAKNIDFMGAIFPDVPSVKLPQQGGGLVSFDDTTDATATADKILQGYTAYVNGEKLVGTASGGITPTGTISITQNGIVDVTQYANADVNVSGGGGGLTLLKAESLGLISYSLTTESSLGKSITVSGVNAYDLLAVEVSVDERQANANLSTLSLILLHSNSKGYADYNSATKSAALIINRLTYRIYVNGNIASSARNIANSICGIYPKTVAISDGTVTLDLYVKYDANYTGTINNNYTARVYGINLYDLIP